MLQCSKINYNGVDWMSWGKIRITVDISDDKLNNAKRALKHFQVGDKKFSRNRLFDEALDALFAKMDAEIGTDWRKSNPED